MTRTRIVLGTTFFGIGTILSLIALWQENALLLSCGMYLTLIILILDLNARTTLLEENQK